MGKLCCFHIHPDSASTLDMNMLIEETDWVKLIYVHLSEHKEFLSKNDLQKLLFSIKDYIYLE